jgi:hypothetical protein
VKKPCKRKEMEDKKAVKNRKETKKTKEKEGKIK